MVRLMLTLLRQYRKKETGLDIYSEEILLMSFVVKDNNNKKK